MSNTGDINILQTGIRTREDVEKKRRDKEANRRKVKEQRKNRVKA